jgi:Peptidase A4 family
VGGSRASVRALVASCSLALIAVGLAAPATAAAQTTASTSAPRVLANCNPGLSTQALAAPDASVDPATATDAQLRAAGYPPRPTVDTAAWVSMMKRPHDFICPQWQAMSAIAPVTEPQGGLTADALGGSTQWWTQIWAGNMDNTDIYNSVSMRWTVPTIATDKILNGTVVIWPGLGNSDSPTDPLVQAGTAQDADPGKVATQYLWWEILPQNCTTCPLVKVANQPLAVNDKVYVSINYGLEGGYNTAIFWIENDNSSGNHVSFFYVTENIGTTQASKVEWIVEAPPGSHLGQWTNSISLTSDEAYDLDTQSTNCAGTQQHLSIHMANVPSDTTTQLAYPAAWTDPGTYCNFPVYRTGVL